MAFDLRGRKKGENARKITNSKSSAVQNRVENQSCRSIVAPSFLLLQTDHKKEILPGFFLCPEHVAPLLYKKEEGKWGLAKKPVVFFANVSATFFYSCLVVQSVVLGEKMLEKVKQYVRWYSKQRACQFRVKSLSMHNCRSYSKKRHARK